MKLRIVMQSDEFKEYNRVDVFAGGIFNKEFELIFENTIVKIPLKNIKSIEIETPYKGG